MNGDAEALDEHQDAIARRAVDLTYAAVPAYAAALDARGRKHCEADARFHLQALTGSVAVGDVAIFADYARWCSELLGRHGIAPQNLVAMLGAIATAVHEIAPDAGDTADLHLRAGEDVLGAL